MPIRTERSLISTAEAAEILGVSQGRVRQMVLPQKNGEDPVLWSRHLGSKILVVDEAEVRKHAKRMNKLRAEGKIRGASPGGFKKDRPGVYDRASSPKQN